MILAVVLCVVVGLGVVVVVVGLVYSYPGFGGRYVPSLCEMSAFTSQKMASKHVIENLGKIN